MNGTDEYVCVNCFTDEGLIRFVEENAVANECSFCVSADDEAIAAPIEDVSQHFLGCISREYDLAVNQLGWVGSEGGYVGLHWDGFDLATDELELEFPQANEGPLLQALFGELFDQDWCRENAYGLDDLERPGYSWEYFKKVVMHQRRYFFLDDAGDPDDLEVLSPAEILQTTFEYAQEMGLFKVLPDGSRIIRARWEEGGERHETPGELGPPPEDKATQANRMSPAGIPMFYGCDDEDTALREAASGPGFFAFGEFETVRTAVLLDLTDIPEVPGLFEDVPDFQAVDPRRALRFLHHVAGEMSRRIERDDRVHIEYVPTQVVTEFIRARVIWGESKVDGIRYASSVDEGHASYVFFADQSNVVGTPASGVADDGWLRLVDTRHRWFEPPRTRDERSCARWCHLLWNFVRGRRRSWG